MMALTASSFCAFMINFQMGQVQGTLVKNTIVSQSAEVAADLASGLIYLWIGPKWTFSSLFLLSVLGSTLLIFYWDNVELIPVFIVMAKLGINGTFNCCFVASIELMPTIFSASAFGLCNVTARTATILSPIIAQMNYPTPLIINISVASFAGFCSLFIIVKPPRA